MLLAVLGCLGISLLATVARATTVEELCGSPVPDPCRITTSHTLEPGAVLDFRPGSLVLATSSARLDAGVGAMAIIARDVTLEAGSKLLAAGGRITVLASGRIAVDAAAKIDASSTGGGGDIALAAGGDILADGPLRAAGIGIPAFGGSIVIGATGAVRVHDVDLSGGTQAAPPGNRGALTVEAGGDVDVGGTVDVSHGECLTCGIQITAGGRLTAGKLLAQATGPGGNGGSITLFGASIVLAGDLAATGGGGDPDFGGGGGDVLVEAEDALDVTGAILLSGTAPDGDGGTFDLSAGGTLRIAPAAVLDAEGGGAGCGGSPSFLTAGVDLAIGRLRLGGGSCGGGSVDAVAERDLTVAARITAGATDDGIGGDVALQATRTARVDADVDAGGPVAGAGGSVVVEGCELRVAPGIAIVSTGPGGINLLFAHGLMAVEGRLEAGFENTLAFGNLAIPPVVTGPVVPPTTPVHDPTLLPCTPASACGDGTRDATEECDDGNVDACDGCSADCRVESCGNGRRDCDEGCDPPDLVRCDASCRVIPQSTVRFPGGPLQHGCQAEWELELADAALKPRGLPQPTQVCTDGDAGCDADDASDGRCTFRARVCLRAADPRLPECTPAAIERVNVRRPLPLDPADPTDAANAAALRNALRSLGITVTQGTTVLDAGVPDAQPDHCTAPFALLVPHDGARKARRRFTIGARDVAGKAMSNNTVKLDCFPNSAQCGDGVVGVGEDCEDGNTQGCDGCSPTCRTEACGNGRIDCDEQCDAGVPNPSPATGCAPDCTELPPELRIPGGGGRSLDCAQEWALVLDDGATALDGRGLPRNRQDCTDGDARCDFASAPGTCRFHLFGCLGGADDRLGCPAAAVTSVDVVRPTPVDQGPLREALVGALGSLAFPVGPGERCTRRVAVDVPAGNKGIVVKLRTRLASGKQDRDALKLRCLAAPR